MHIDHALLHTSSTLITDTMQRLVEMHRSYITEGPIGVLYHRDNKKIRYHGFLYLLSDLLIICQKYTPNTNPPPLSATSSQSTLLLATSFSPQSSLAQQNEGINANFGNNLASNAQAVNVNVNVNGGASDNANESMSASPPHSSLNYSKPDAVYKVDALVSLTDISIEIKEQSKNDKDCLFSLFFYSIKLT